MSKKRIQNSVGKSIFNNGALKQSTVTPFVIDKSRRFFMFDIVPCSAPRMTQSDRWKLDPLHKDPNKRQREAVAKYFKFKDELRAIAKELNYQLKEQLEIVFIIPMSDSWSEKKKEKFNRMPNKNKPDADNLIKSFKDSLKGTSSFIKDDCEVWNESAKKIWGYTGAIIVYE